MELPTWQEKEAELPTGSVILGAVVFNSRLTLALSLASQAFDTSIGVSLGLGCPAMFK